MSADKSETASQKLMREVTRMSYDQKGSLRDRLSGGPSAAFQKTLNNIIGPVSLTESVSRALSATNQPTASTVMKTTLGQRNMAELLEKALGLSRSDSILDYVGINRVRNRASELDAHLYGNDIAAIHRNTFLSPKRIAHNPVSVSIRSAADLGPLVRKVRKAAGLTQSDFAAHAGVGRRFLSELESGKPSLEFDKVMACAAAAGIEIFSRPHHSQ